MGESRKKNRVLEVLGVENEVVRSEIERTEFVGVMRGLCVCFHEVCVFLRGLVVETDSCSDVVNTVETLFRIVDCVSGCLSQCDTLISGVCEFVSLLSWFVCEFVSALVDVFLSS